MCFHSKYLTEELRRIFIEDTDSDAEEFEGFTESEMNVSSDPEVMQSCFHEGVGCNVLSAPRGGLQCSSLVLSFPFILTYYLTNEKKLYFLFYF